MMGEPAAAGAQLERAAELAMATENQRDLRAVRAVASQLRKHWPRVAEVRRLEEVLRAGLPIR